MEFRFVLGVRSQRSALHAKRLDPVADGAEDTIPHASLLAIVAARLAEAVVQIVILHRELHVESLEPPQDGVSPVGADARVAEHLNVLLRSSDVSGRAVREGSAKDDVRSCSKG